MNRGSQQADPPNSAHEATSMRPRFMNRGSLGCTGGKASPVIHFNEAPIHESGKFR